MAWTTPITFTTGNALTAAQMNTYVRDNTNFLFSPPSCSVQRGADLTGITSTSTLSAVPFAPAGGVDWDTDPTMHSNTTNPSRITVHTAGLFHVSGGGKWAIASGGARYMAIRKNGGSNDLCNDSRLPLASDNSWQNVGADVSMAASDYIELYVAQTSGGSLTLLGSANGGAFLQIHWIGHT